MATVLLLLAAFCPALAAAADPALFKPARSLAALEHASTPPPDVPTIVPQSFQAIEELPPGDETPAELLPIPPEELPQPAEMLPRVTGPPPPKPPDQTPIPGAALDDRDEPLTLRDVLESVMRHYPLLQAVERERSIAAGRLTSAMGAFDTNVNGTGNALAPGTYENYRSDFGLSQMLPQGGVTMFGGYRNGYGTFPTYNLKQLTADSGEFRGGLNVPLAKNRDIDKARASRAQAQLDVALAEPTIERSRLDYMRAAARTYWLWNGSGERKTAAEYLVDLALERDVEIGLRVERGAVANIERVDNQQNIALRQGVVVQTDRAVQEATIDLSLFYRDAQGCPLLPSRKRMRTMPMPVEPTTVLFEQSLSRALARRPEFQRLGLQREKLVIERRLAENQTLPGLDAQLAGNQDAGFGKSSLSGPNGLDRQVLEATLIFQMPAQRREARGRVQATQAQLSQLERQLQFTYDQVRAEVQDTFSALERAYEFHRQVKDRVELSKTVARAEREQLRLGRSDVLRVTLREQAKFEALVLEIAAREEFWKAESDLRAVDTSLGPDTSGFPAGLLIDDPRE